MKEVGIGAPGGRGDPAGHVHYELYLLAALVIISLSIGIPFAEKYGLAGAALATLLTFFGIIACVAALFWALNLMGLVHGRWQDRSWYQALLATVRFVLLWVLVSIVGAGASGALALGLDLSPAGSELLVSIAAPTAGILGVLARLRFPDAFWPEFGRLCLFLGLAVVGAFIGMLAGSLSASPTGVLVGACVGAVVPLVAYAAWLLWRRLGRPTAAPGEPPADETEEGKS